MSRSVSCTVCGLPRYYENIRSLPCRQHAELWGVGSMLLSPVPGAFVASDLSIFSCPCPRPCVSLPRVCLEQACWADIKLYEFARELMEKQVAACRI